jgi:DNA-binding PadR family transcriptional regulator
VTHHKDPNIEERQDGDTKKLYRINERGQEFFRPNIEGQVIPIIKGNPYIPKDYAIRITHIDDTEETENHT